MQKLMWLDEQVCTCKREWKCAYIVCGRPESDDRGISVKRINKTHRCFDVLGTILKRNIIIIIIINNISCTSGQSPV